MMLGRLQRNPPYVLELTCCAPWRLHALLVHAFTLNCAVVRPLLEASESEAFPVCCARPPAERISAGFRLFVANSKTQQFTQRGFGCHRAWVALDSSY